MDPDLAVERQGRSTPQPKQLPEERISYVTSPAGSPDRAKRASFAFDVPRNTTGDHKLARQSAAE